MTDQSLAKKLGEKGWTAKRKARVVVDVITGRITISQASRHYRLSPPEVEQLIEEAERGLLDLLRCLRPYFSSLR